ncbi:hypothetical protein Csa_013683 [Cucumis sativus]|uniref:Uncharacterized protein n=1 Tax=Cucumis sativus TaxID=3659 RepID=A0A0A0LWP7_CUCSA|nr:hypothetical protein Csa_013683 [Cucumis sativus]
MRAHISAPSTNPDAIVVDIDCTISFKFKKRLGIATKILFMNGQHWGIMFERFLLLVNMGKTRRNESSCALLSMIMPYQELFLPMILNDEGDDSRG